PENDVHVLAGKLAEDRAVSHAFGSDAGADRVKRWLDGVDGDLGPQTGLARQSAHLHRAGLYLRDLGLQQAVEERARGSRHTHLRLPVIALGIEDHDQHWPSRMQLLAGDLLLRRHHTLGPTQVDVHSAGPDAVDDPCRKLASMPRHL